MMKLDLTYILPLRWSSQLDRDELTAYLTYLTRFVDEVIVVDGSSSEAWDQNHRSWSAIVEHVPVHDDLSFSNGKVSGVTTGVRIAQHEKIVIGDDDVRYDEIPMRQVWLALDDADLVRPQNYYAPPFPWHAVWDSARSLINRSVGADFPGTMGFRRTPYLEMGGYDGNVMFENLELILTMEAHGGRCVAPLDIYVRREPPTAEWFMSQRVRQAFDELALPARLFVWLSVVPTLACLALRGRIRTIAALVLGVMGLAERGRRIANGRGHFPTTAVVIAPLWVLERGICIWVALGSQLRGGIPYRGGRVERAAHTRRWHRKRRQG